MCLGRPSTVLTVLTVGQRNMKFLSSEADRRRLEPYSSLSPRPTHDHHFLGVGRVSVTRWGGGLRNCLSFPFFRVQTRKRPTDPRERKHTECDWGRLVKGRKGTRYTCLHGRHKVTRRRPCVTRVDVSVMSVGRSHTVLTHRVFPLRPTVRT